jgi:nifR3 family TIM-barrel protein
MQLPAGESRKPFWHHLPRPIIGLAPMDGVSDAAFRFIVAKHGKPDVAFTEFTSVGDVCRGPEFTLSSFAYDECERPIVAQLYGKDPDLFYQAAHVVCELGFDGLDINMGCPSHNVASSGSGAGLIRTPARAHEILRATQRGILDWNAGQTLQEAGLKLGRVHLVQNMNLRRAGRTSTRRAPIPLSVKTRLGYDVVVVEDWVSHLLELRPSVISLHGRTLAQMYRGAADWEAIRRAVELVRRHTTETLVLGNGDLRLLSDVVSRVKESGVDGVLVGRGTLGSPWVFSHKERARAFCNGGVGSTSNDLDVYDLSLTDRFRIMQAHARIFETLSGVDRFPSMRKHLGWYCKGFPHAAAMRARMVRASSSTDVDRIVAEYLIENGQSTQSHAEPASCAPSHPAVA